MAPLVALPSECKKDYVSKNLYGQYEVEKEIQDFFSDVVSHSKEIKENHYYANIKILVGLLAIAVGVYGQFYVKFPVDKEWIKIVVPVYFALSGVLMYLDKVYMTNLTICFDYKKEGPYLFYSSMEQFNQEIKFTMKTKDGRVEEMKNDIGRYYYDNGHLVNQQVLDDFNHLLSLLAGKKTN